MALSFLYLMTRRLIGMLLGCLRSEHPTEVEIAVLRHQLKVLRRQVKRPELRPADRAVLAVLSGVLPRPHWSAFLVTPGTILPWHRRLVTRKWTQPDAQGGRPPLAEPVVAVILQSARENPAGATGASKENSRSWTCRRNPVCGSCRGRWKAGADMARCWLAGREGALQAAATARG